MGPQLELTAAAAEDPLLGERLRAETAPSRLRLLGEADRLRAGGEPQRRLAAIVYRALHADIDPSEGAGASRASWFVSQVQWLDPTAAPLVRRTADACADPEVRMRATVLAARYSEADGDVEEADRLLRVVVDTVRGTRTPLEFSALFHLARVAANHEDCARALAWSARALDLDPPGLAPRWIALAHRCRADAFGTMRDAVRCEREFVAAEAVVQRLDRSESRSLRADIAAARARALLVRGEPERAIGFLIQALDDGGESSPHRIRSVHVMGAQAALGLDRAEAAAAHVARALRAPARDDLLDLELELLQVRLQRVAGGAVSARPRAIAFVQKLAGAGRRVVGPDRRARLAVEAARILAEPDGDPDAARRAYDLAVSAVLESVSRAIRDAESCPEAGRLGPDDLAALREHRDSAMGAHRDLQQAIAAFLEGAIRRHGPSFIARLGGASGRLAACAWCSRVRGPGGSWLPIGHYLPSEDTLDLTHGICEDCTGALHRNLARTH